MENNRSQSKVCESSESRMSLMLLQPTMDRQTDLSGETSLNSPWLAGLAWERKEAVKTNWPTVLAKLKTH
jgi:hypothetical protein